MENEITKKEKTRRIRNVILITAGFAAAAVILYILAKNGISISCPINKFTGLLCPGCGNTRAAMALLRLDIAAAFSYNPLFPVEFFYLIWVYVFACKRYIKTKRFTYSPPCQWLDLAILVILTIGTIIRNILMIISKFG
ncbi:MAG: DUF2752 domain-containing protein [Clostridia bacterium]|nr:DUF2752 domain-containing protein [Clostridia bacterium]